MVEWQGSRNIPAYTINSQCLVYENNAKGNISFLSTF